MKKDSMLEKLPGALLPWYAENKRILPWRMDKEPYHIWLSEIMLQQTRVEAVKGYYTRFLEALPDIPSLAAAEQDQLNKLWEGLGYYSRVRNLKKAAIMIMENHGGVFPKNYADIRLLPGIGDYTAGAICSIAYGEKTPAVDGNVLRIFSRLTNDHTPIDTPEAKKTARETLQAIYPEAAGDFTQALMELGATICGPNRKPDCEQCPCKSFCQAYQKQTVDSLPVKSPKRPRKQVDMTVLILRCGDCYAIEKRAGRGLLAGLWQFPNFPGHMEISQVLELLVETKMENVLRQVERTHIFTHIQWNMRGYFVDVQSMGREYQWVPEEQIASEVALPTAFRQFWDLRKIPD